MTHRPPDLKESLERLGSVNPSQNEILTAVADMQDVAATALGQAADERRICQAKLLSKVHRVHAHGRRFYRNPKAAEQGT